MPRVLKKRTYTDQSTRRGKGSNRNYWAAKASASRMAGLPRLFAHQVRPTADLALVALARYTWLSPAQLADICGITNGNAGILVRGLQRRGLVHCVKADDYRTARLAVALDRRHAGAEHLRRYLDTVGAATEIKTPASRLPAPASDPPPFPERPIPLFFSRSRTNYVLALGLVAEMPLRDLRAIGSTTRREGTADVVLRLWRMKQVIATRPFETNKNRRYAFLNPDFPGMEHLRPFFAATASAYEKRLVLRVRAVLF